jgi:hypothetical protein
MSPVSERVFQISHIHQTVRERTRRRARTVPWAGQALGILAAGAGQGVNVPQGQSACQGRRRAITMSKRQRFRQGSGWEGHKRRVDQWTEDYFRNREHARQAWFPGGPPTRSGSLPVVQYMLERTELQGCGIGTSLLNFARQTAQDPTGPMWMTHYSYSMKRLMKPFNLMYNPFLLHHESSL